MDASIDLSEGPAVNPAVGSAVIPSTDTAEDPAVEQFPATWRRV